MKRFVVWQNGDLSIVTTGGKEPIGMICEAKDHWSSKTIAYDRNAKVVVYDPDGSARIKPLPPPPPRSDIVYKTDIPWLVISRWLFVFAIAAALVFIINR